MRTKEVVIKEYELTGWCAIQIAIRQIELNPVGFYTIVVSFGGHDYYVASANDLKKSSEDFRNWKKDILLLTLEELYKKCSELDSDGENIKGKVWD